MLNDCCHRAGFPDHLWKHYLKIDILWVADCSGSGIVKWFSDPALDSNIMMKYVFINRAVHNTKIFICREECNIFSLLLVRWALQENSHFLRRGMWVLQYFLYLINGFIDHTSDIRHTNRVGELVYGGWIASLAAATGTAVDNCLEEKNIMPNYLYRNYKCLIS